MFTVILLLFVWRGIMTARVYAISQDVSKLDLSIKLEQNTQDSLISKVHSHIRRSTHELEENRNSLGRLKREVTAECGRLHHHSRLRRLTGDSSSEIENAPWHGALYIGRNNSFRFAGGVTLIDDDKVITGAVMVIKPFPTQTQHDPKDIKIVFGKSRIDPELHGTEEEIYEVSKIITPTTYKGRSTHYTHNIALLVLQRKVNRNNKISPVCIDLENNSVPLKNEQILQVPMYDTAEYNEAYIFQIRTVTYIDRESCRKEVTESFSIFVTEDTFCNRLTGNDGLNSIRQGVGGSGVISKRNDTNRHFIEGIVSLKQADVKDQFVTTSIREHAKWIQQSLSSL